MLSPSSLSARWEEEYTVRMQLQERVHELQEVRAPHCPGSPQSSPCPSVLEPAPCPSFLVLTFLPCWRPH